MSQFSKEYKQFFESPAGTEFLTTMTNMIDSNHEKAENEPDKSRDYMQRAKGNREVLNVVKSILAERKVED